LRTLPAKKFERGRPCLSIGTSVVSIMSAPNSFFKNIAIRFSSAEELFTHLESADGGLLKVVRNKDYPHLALIRYVKGYSNMDHTNAHYFRSVIWNTATNKPVCVAPFKSLPMTSYEASADYIVEDFWDGTMLNMFYDEQISQWVLATRSNVGANCRFYSSQNFTKLFWDTFNLMGLKIMDFPQNGMYSWVLQHPENRIVVPSMPILRLVQMALVEEDGVNFNPAVPPTLMNLMNRRLALEGIAATTKALTDMVTANNTVFCQGYVVKNPLTGERWKIRTAVYTLIKDLRGNTPRLDYRWLELRQKGSLNQYMQHYPEDKVPFDALWNRLKTQTRLLYQWYSDVFKARSMKSQDAPKFLRRMLYHMHDHYLNRLRPAQQTLTWAACVQWVNSQDIPRQLFLANYQWLAANKAAQSVYPYEPTDENLVASAPSSVPNEDVPVTDEVVAV